MKYFLLLLAIFLSCTSSDNLTNVFDELESNFYTTKALEYIRICPQDSLKEVLSVFNVEIGYMIRREDNGIDQKMIDVALSEVKPEFREEVLIIAFRSYLDGENVDLEQCEAIVSKRRSQKSH